MKVQLTISMLVSDKSDSVRKCLDSLLPILRVISSELILVYTGTGKKNLKIAQEYTEHIIPFEWCDDFSKARNAGLQEADGEWFMYIDDDEWFEDCSEIVDFFQSGEYKNYKKANYMVRNYFDINGLTYSDTTVSRLMELSPEAEFVGAIHEYLSPLRLPAKYFKSYVHHYGYVSLDSDKRKEKSDRNVPLLEKELERDPKNLRNHVQLAQEFYGIGEYEKAEISCRNALGLLDVNESERYGNWAAVFLVASISAQHDIKGALEEGKTILSTRRISELAASYMYIFLMPICLTLKKYEDGIVFADAFAGLMKKLDQKPEMWDEQQILDITRDNILLNGYYVYTNGIVCASRLNNYKKAKEYVEYLPWDTRYINNTFYEFFENWKAIFKDKKEEILSCFESLQAEDSYVKCQKALLAEHRKDNNLAELYHNCDSTENAFVQYHMILMALRNHYSLPGFMDEIDLDMWKRCAQNVSNTLEFSSYSQYMECLLGMFSEYPIHLLVLEQKLLAKMLFNPQLNQDDFMLVISRYCDVVIKHYRMLYRPELFEKTLLFCLPIDCRAALNLEALLLDYKRGEFSTTIEQLKELFIIYPSLGYVIKRILSQIEYDLEHTYVEKSAKAEFNETGKQIKAIMKNLADNEKYEEALSVAEKLSLLLPDDLEILRYKQLLQKITN